MLDQLLAGLLKRVLDKCGPFVLCFRRAQVTLTHARPRLDRNKAVQRSACSGLSALLEEAQHALTPRLGVIAQHLVAALGMVRAWRRGLRA